MTIRLVQNTSRHNRAKKINNDATNVPYQRSGILALIFIKLYLLKHNIIVYLNCKASWNRITLLENLQQQKKM
jgi:hypothetical protein